MLPDASRQALPEWKYGFRVSPDGRRVSVPGKEGQVGVAELKTGKVQEILGKDWAGDFKFQVPVWRSSDELCLMVPAGSPHGSANRPELVLYGTDGKSRCLSKSWPDAVIKGLAEQRDK